MLIRYAKLAGSLRLLVSTAAPLVTAAISLLSVRSAAYLVGFGLSSILSIWLPIVATLISLTGAFDGNTDTSACDAYRAEMRRIAEYNEALSAAWAIQYEAYRPTYEAWILARQAHSDAVFAAGRGACEEICAATPVCTVNDGETCGFSCYFCWRNLAELDARTAPPMPEPPPYPNYLVPNRSECGSTIPPDCPQAKKVWLQVIWGSPAGNASDAKGCFIVGYSQDSRDLPVNIEYNPYLPQLFVKNQAFSYDLVKGNRFFGLDPSSAWKDLDSVEGWDKGYWSAEIVHPECRGWRPGWSLKIK
jgi:hypothetical protein